MKKKHLDLTVIKHLHSLMLQAQKKNKDFDLTFDEIAGAWGYKSKSICSIFLPALEKAGLAKSMTRGSKTVYRALEKEK